MSARITLQFQPGNQLQYERRGPAPAGRVRVLSMDGSECIECKHSSGHLYGCSRDLSRPRPRPPDPPRPKAKSNRRICGSCGNPVGVPGTRHKYDCPEYVGGVKKEVAAVSPVILFKEQPIYVPEQIQNSESAAGDDVRPEIPGAAALKILRGPFASRNVVRGLMKLDDADLRWVLAALYRIVRGQ